MPWLLASPGHQQPWYWLCRIGRSLSNSRRNFLCLINVEEWHKMQIYVYVLPPPPPPPSPPPNITSVRWNQHCLKFIRIGLQRILQSIKTIMSFVKKFRKLSLSHYNKRCSYHWHRYKCDNHNQEKISLINTLNSIGPNMDLVVRLW